MNEVMKSEQQDRELALSNKVSDYLSSYNIFKVFISYIEAGNLINLCYFFMVFPHIF